MSSDLISTLQLDKEFGASRVLVAKEINGCDSSFITSCILSNCIKNKNAVLLVSTHNAFSHYQNVGLKMNCNLQKHVDSGLVNFWYAGEEIVKILINQNDVPEQFLFTTTKEKFLQMKKQQVTVNIIFDGLSHLFDLQQTLPDVNNFCREIIALVSDYDNTFVLFHCNVATEDDVTNVMSNLLCHKAHTVIEVESLSSGWSADVSGRLTLKHPQIKFEDEHTYIMDMKPSKYLFKLFDRGVKLFAPGTV